MPPVQPALVEVRNLRKQYGDVVALDDVSFDVREGEVLGLIGPNGAGKTTLLECLARVLPRDDGSIGALDLLPVRGGPPLAFYVPDGIAPWPAQTVRWVLEYTVGFFGGDPAAMPGVIEELDLEARLDVRIGHLSKGQRKRAMLAIGFLTRSALLLIDEPFEGLDLRQTRSVAAQLRAQAATGRTLFLSVHQIADASRVCERFVLLGGGRVRGEGTIDELRARAGGVTPDLASLEEIFLALT